MKSGPENCFLIGSGLGHRAQICKELQIGPKGDLGPEKYFLIGIWTGPKGQNCKELQFRPKRSFGPRRLKEASDWARITRWTRLGINVIDEAQYVINFTSVVKLGKPKTYDKWILYPLIRYSKLDVSEVLE